MQVITLLNEKGGVGKTTWATTLGCGLAIRGQRVMLVDADPQGNLTMGLGFDRHPGLFELLVNGKAFSEVAASVPRERYAGAAQPEPEAGEKQGALYLVPGHKGTRAIPTMIDDSWMLAELIESLADDLDVVIFDTPPTPSMLHASIYLATDYVVYPTELEYFSFSGLVDSITSRAGFNKERLHFGRTEIGLGGIIPNKYRKKTVEHQENLAKLQKQFGASVWPEVPLNILWSETASFKCSIFCHAPKSAAARLAWKLVDLTEGMIAHE